MIKRISMSVAAAAMLVSVPSSAELASGAKAPNFSARGAKAGKVISFNLRLALSKGPVVLYFYPKAFTKGCTLEANAFAEAMGDFEAAGATVVGLSNDDLPTLLRFSEEECRDEFAVASATPAVIRAYDVALTRNGEDTGLSKRTSYVIDQRGRVAFVHSNSDWRGHVSKSLAKVRAMKRAKK